MCIQAPSRRTAALREILLALKLRYIQASNRPSIEELTQSDEADHNRQFAVVFKSQQSSLRLAPYMGYRNGLPNDYLLRSEMQYSKWADKGDHG